MQDRVKREIKLDRSAVETATTQRKFGWCADYKR